MNEQKTDGQKKANKKIIIGIAVLLIAIAAFSGIYFLFGAKPVAGSKSITIEVVDDRQETTAYQLQTEVEFLRQAMEEAEGLSFSGTESEYGMMVDTVNGLTADYNTDGAYWSFYVNGDYCNYGIDSQPVLDGDIFSIRYTLATP
ncbi:MAG: DUF4430 domain-containing protein [Acetatifactor sp.]|nr:DUF4430 domain-containing protein [Acetatifactor sp.]MDE7113343.1 DUF4430 domain-containing protein [Acetatifactor sp.]